jgi:nucleotide-binding universal stress UspA family protein
MYERILVPVDDSQPAREALLRARALAEWSGASVYVLHAVRVDNPLSFGLDEVVELYEVETGLDGLSAEYFDADDDVHRVIRRGVPSEAIVEFAEEEGVDLIVMGRQGKSDLRDRMLGSTSSRVLQTTTVPILLVGHGEDVDGVEDVEG